jgi:hypothetical protein
VATAAALAGLAALSVAALLVFSGRLPLAPRLAPGGAAVYLVPYPYGFAFYNRDLKEIDAIEVRVGETVTLHVVPAQALPEPVFRAYAARSMKRAIGGLSPGDPRMQDKIREDLALGNVEHIVGIEGHPVYVTTDVASVLGGRPFRQGGPATLAEAVAQRDPAIKTVTFTAKRAGSFDVLCVDSGMDGAGTCGWGHKWMVASKAFVVRPRRRDSRAGRRGSGHGTLHGQSRATWGTLRCEGARSRCGLVVQPGWHSGLSMAQSGSDPSVRRERARRRPGHRAGPRRHERLWQRPRSGEAPTPGNSQARFQTRWQILW